MVYLIFIKFSFINIFIKFNKRYPFRRRMLINQSKGIILLKDIFKVNPYQVYNLNLFNNFNLSLIIIFPLKNIYLFF
jgi:hypothetical protein